MGGPNAFVSEEQPYSWKTLGGEGITLYIILILWKEDTLLTLKDSTTNLKTTQILAHSFRDPLTLARIYRFHLLETTVF